MARILAQIAENVIPAEVPTVTSLEMREAATDMGVNAAFAAASARSFPGILQLQGIHWMERAIDCDKLLIALRTGAMP